MYTDKEYQQDHSQMILTDKHDIQWQSLAHKHDHGLSVPEAVYIRHEVTDQLHCPAVENGGDPQPLVASPIT